jgi:hypothetical protein
VKSENDPNRSPGGIARTIQASENVPRRTALQIFWALSIGSPPSPNERRPSAAIANPSGE